MQVGLQGIEHRRGQRPADRDDLLHLAAELDRRAGMLFSYPRPQELTMWMRNTYIPLDMVFIRADGVVHRIEENTEPFSEIVRMFSRSATNNSWPISSLGR